MAYINKVKVTIGGKYQLTAIKEVKIKSTWKDSCDTCKLEVPNLEKYIDKGFKEGDKIKVDLSMSTSAVQDDFKTEFQGYIARIQNATPFTLHCEDEAYIWKRKKAISKFYKEITLEKLLKELFGDAVVISDSIFKLTLQKFTIKRATPYEVLSKLKKMYHLTAYFKGGQLHVGTQYLIEKTPPVKIYHLDGGQGNIVKDSLIYKSKESLKLKARVVSIMKDGKKIELTEGDADGAERTLFYRDIKEEAELRKLAKAQLEKLKKDTVEGSIEAFGLPYTQHSYHAKLKSEKYPKKNGTFFIDQVETSFGTSGFRRRLKLGKKMSQ